MRARAAIAILAAAVALLAAAPVSAAGSPSAPELLAGASRLNDELTLLGRGSRGLGLPPSHPLQEFRFENRDGFTIAVFAFEQTIALSVIRDRGRRSRNRVSTTTYLAHGEVTPTSITASFGDRGRIAVRFRPSGRDIRATRKAGCRRPGGGTLARLGVFAGTLRFLGEGGYTSAEVHRARGRSVDLEALIACLRGSLPRRQAILPPGSPPDLHALALAATKQGTPSVPTNPSTGPKVTTLLANSKAPLSRTIFGARVKGHGKVHFVAVDVASEGSIGILRVILVRGPSSTFDFDDTLARAAISPPAPFSGVGRLAHGSGDAKSWTGSLAVSFLGAPHVPLTGSPFSTGLARSW